MKKMSLYLALALLAISAITAPSSASEKSNKALQAVSRFASRAELSYSMGATSIMHKPPQGDIGIDDYGYYLGVPHGTGYYWHKSRVEVNTARMINPMLSIGTTIGGQWRIPVKSGSLRAIIPGYAERKVIATEFLESTNLPGIYSISGMGGMNSYSYSLSTQWKTFKNKTLEIAYNRTRVCSATNPNCRLTMHSSLLRLEMYPDHPGRFDWDVRAERHNRERFDSTGYHVRLEGKYNIYRGLNAGLVLGAYKNGMCPAVGSEFSDIASHLVFQYLNGGSTSFNQFYTHSFAYYKWTLGYNLAF